MFFKIIPPTTKPITNQELFKLVDPSHEDKSKKDVVKLLFVNKKKSALKSSLERSYRDGSQIKKNIAIVYFLTRSILLEGKGPSGKSESTPLNNQILIRMRLFNKLFKDPQTPLKLKTMLAISQWYLFKLGGNRHQNFIKSGVKPLPNGTAHQNSEKMRLYNVQYNNMKKLVQPINSSLSNPDMIAWLKPGGISADYMPRRAVLKLDLTGYGMENELTQIRQNFNRIEHMLTQQ
jgi:hypothetical protein